MKLSAREANSYFAKPDASRTGLLIYGADAMRVALKRQQVILALIGATGADEMRLTRISAAELRKDPALLDDAMKAQSFFPGPRVAFVEDATDSLAPAINAGLADWQAGDAHVIVVAGSLKASSALRKAFEQHPNAYAVGIYDDPPGRDEIEAELGRAGLTSVGPDAMADLMAFSRSVDPGDFRQTIEKLALYKLSDPTPVTSDDIANCAPATTEAALDDLFNTVAELRDTEIGPLMRRLEGQGAQAVGLCIGAMRHFRALYAASCDSGGPAAGVARMRPPVFGPRRDKMIRQAQQWSVRNLETALQLLTETDLSLRSTARAPQMAVVERAFIRLAMLGKR